MKQTIYPSRILQCLIVVGMFAVTAWFYQTFPDQIPVHWNISGQPNAWAPKTWGAWLLPGIALLLTLLFPLFAKIDPKRDNYKYFSHAWNMLQLVIVAFLAYMEYIVLYATFHPGDASMGRSLLIGIGLLFVIMGNYMGKIRQNWFIGVRTPWSISDPEVWQKSQRVGGWTIVIGGIAMILLGFLAPTSVAGLLTILIVIVIVPVVYSYIAYRQKQ